MADLSRKRTRLQLEPRREPYWQRLNAGAYLGFRAGPSTWIARFRDRAGKQQYRALGDEIEFDEAKDRAETWLTQVGGSVARSAKRGTVKEALESYLADLHRHRRADTARDALWRFKLVVYGDEIADLDLEQATREDFLEWRDRQQEGRQPRTVNRHVRAVAAALNFAHGAGHVGNPMAWKLSPLGDDVEDAGETAVFLTPVQRSALIGAVTPAAADFLRGLELTGARPKELAAARVGDFDGKTLRLAHRKGRPSKLRTRQTVLSAEGIVFFKRCANGKLPAALLLSEDAEGMGWRAHTWSRAIRAGIAAHNKKVDPKGKAPAKRIPVTASAYSFRHARISELLQVHGIDPLTVAVQCGTSIAMIERFYYKFVPAALCEKLAAVKESA